MTYLKLQLLYQWLKIIQIANANPDLHYSIIRGILLSLEDVRMKQVAKYNPDSI